MPSYTGSVANALGEEYVQRSMTDLTEQTSYNATRVCAKYFGQEVWSEIAGLIARQVSDADYVTQWTCGASDAIGDPVRISAASTVTKALATTEANSRVIGVIRHKGTLGAANAPTATTCYLAHYHIATGLSGGTPGSPVYLTNSGGYSASAGTYTRQVGVFVSSTVGMICVDSKASIIFGTSAGTACEGNDSRLSNARTPVGTALTQNKIWVGNGSNLAAEADLPSGGNYVNLALNPGFETVLPGTHTDAIKLLTTGSKNSCMPGWQFAGEGGGLRAESDTDTITGASYRSAKIKATTPSAPVTFFQEWSAAEYLASLAHSFRGKRLVFGIDMCFGAFLEGSFGTIKAYIYCDGTGGGTTYGTTYTSNSNWVRRVVSAVIPDDCTEIKFGIEVDTEETNVTVYVDNVMVVQSDAALTSLPYSPRPPLHIDSRPIDSASVFSYSTPADTNYHITGDGTADVDFDFNAVRPAWATRFYGLVQLSGTAGAGAGAGIKPSGDTYLYYLAIQQTYLIPSLHACDCPIGADGQLQYYVDNLSVDLDLHVKKWMGENL